MTCHISSISLTLLCTIETISSAREEQASLLELQKCVPIEQLGSAKIITTAFEAMDELVSLHTKYSNDAIPTIEHLNVKYPQRVGCRSMISVVKRINSTCVALKEMGIEPKMLNDWVVVADKFILNAKNSMIDDCKQRCTVTSNVSLRHGESDVMLKDFRRGATTADETWASSMGAKVGFKTVKQRPEKTFLQVEPKAVQHCVDDLNRVLQSLSSINETVNEGTLAMASWSCMQCGVRLLVLFMFRTLYGTHHQFYVAEESSNSGGEGSNTLSLFCR